MCVVTSDKHPLAAHKTVSMEALAGEQFIMLSPDSYSSASKNIINLCRQGGFEPNVVAHCNIVPSMLMLVKCGTGISFVAHDAQSLGYENLRFIPIDNEQAKMRTHLCWKKTNRNPAMASFLESAKILLKKEEVIV